MPRLPRFKRSEKKGVPEESSAQSNQPDTTPTPGLLGFFKFKSTSRSPSPRPPSSAASEARVTSLGQREQQKASKAPRTHDDVVTEPITGTSSRQEVRGGPQELAPEKETNVFVATAGESDEQYKPKIGPGPNEQQQTTQHDPGEDGGGKGLWAKAYDKLPDELKQQLVPGKLQALKDVLEAANDVKEANIAKRLKLKCGDKEIDVQETADRLVRWIAKFKEVGDIAVQYDPIHAALPWAGVRFILLVRNTICTLS